MTTAFFLLEPEVAGGLGPRTVMDRGTHPPHVTTLHYEFDGWLGDELLEAFPCYVVSEQLANDFVALGLTGFDLDAVDVSVSATFLELHGARDLPRFHWFKPCGDAGVDDFGIGADLRLVASARALDAIRCRASHCDCVPSLAR